MRTLGFCGGRRYFIIRRKYSSAILLSILVFLIVLIGFGVSKNTANAVKTNAVSERRLPIYGVNTEEKKLAITFDCAWENSDTQILLELLGKYNIKATFFTTGDFCERYPDDVKLWAEAGHSIQNHSYNHPHVENIEAKKLIEDTKKCDEIIEGITGKRPILYRAPYGEYSDNMLKVFEEELGHKVIQWDCDSIDWKKPSPDEIVNRITKKARNGSILLFHNDTEPTPKALELLIPRLLSDGYEFVLVEDLIAFENYTLDHEGRQVVE